MAVAPDDWRLIAEGDSTAVPDVALPSGSDYLIVVTLPFGVPDALAGALSSGISAALAPFATVRGVEVAGDRVSIELAG